MLQIARAETKITSIPLALWRKKGESRCPSLRRFLLRLFILLRIALLNYNTDSFMDAQFLAPSLPRREPVLCAESHRVSPARPPLTAASRAFSPRYFPDACPRARKNAHAQPSSRPPRLAYMAHNGQCRADIARCNSSVRSVGDYDDD